MATNLILLGLTPTRAVQLGNHIAKYYGISMIDFNQFLQQAPISRSGLHQPINLDIWLMMVEAYLDEDEMDDGYVLLGFPNDVIEAKELQKKLHDLKKPLTQVIQVATPSARQQPDEQLLKFYAKKKILLTIDDSKSLKTLMVSISKKIK